LVAGGVGITPLFSILQAAVPRETSSSFELIYGPIKLGVREGHGKRDRLR